jgi:hypothetical protein
MGSFASIRPEKSRVSMSFTRSEFSARAARVQKGIKGRFVVIGDECPIGFGEQQRL